MLAATERLAGEGGVEAVTVRAAAAAAGTTTRAVYALFGSKEGLVEALTRRCFDLLTDRVKAVPLTDDPVEDLITGSVQGFRAFALEHPDLFRLVFGFSLPAGAWTAEAQATQRASYQQLIGRVERAASAGLLGGHSVMEVVLWWDAICSGLAMREVCGLIDPAVAEQVWHGALRALLAGIGSLSGR